MHPFPALMKRYCIDYTNSHDVSWLPRIMTDDYVVHICGHDLVRDELYKSSVEQIFEAAPGLGLTLHELYCNGDRLAMRFSEHARFPKEGNAYASWRGFSTYTWDGDRLTSCWVEQDFESRKRQFETGRPMPVQPPHIDPWMGEPVPHDQAALDSARDWLSSFDLSRAAAFAIDDSPESDDWHLAVNPQSVRINDIFSAGRKVPFHATLTGELARAPGQTASIAACGVISVGEDGGIEKVEAVLDRFTAFAT